MRASFASVRRYFVMIIKGMAVPLVMTTIAGCQFHPSLANVVQSQHGTVVRVKGAPPTRLTKIRPLQRQASGNIPEQGSADHLYPGLLAIAAPGVRLNVVPDPRVRYDGWWVLQATNKGHKVLIGDLNQLRGLVQISTPDAALGYVRLWAAPGERGALIGWNLEREVTDVETYLEHPKWYGYKRHLPTAELRGDHLVFRSGIEGILSERAFQQGGFFTPRVTLVPGGYTITRWTFWYIEPRNVQEIQEFVGNDGSYRRVILKRMKPPQLPGTYWEGFSMR